MTWLKRFILFSILFSFSALLFPGEAEARLSDAATGTSLPHPSAALEPPTDRRAEADRLKRVQACRASGDVDCMLDHMTAAERTAAFKHQLTQGSVRKLRPGENPEGFKIRIHVTLGKGSGQYLEVSHPGGKFRTPVSGGLGGYSNAIRRQCFVPHSSFELARSQKYNNAPMYNALFFMGRNGNETGNVFAIHGTDAENRLGNAASKGCIRVSKAAAKTIRSLVGNNTESTVICID